MHKQPPPIFLKFKSWASNFLSALDPQPKENVKTHSEPTLENNNELFLNGTWYRFEQLQTLNLFDIYKKIHIVSVKDIPTLGQKLQPLFEPKFKFFTRIEATSIEQAVHKLIVSNYQPTSDDADTVIKSTKVIPTEVSDLSSSTYSKTERKKTPFQQEVIGQLLYAGKKDFPDKNVPGRTYSSFCLEIKTGISSQLLQGEGLNSKLVEVGGKVGDKLRVKRLGSVDVPIIDKATKQPKLDSQGKPLMTPKREWEIQIIQKGN